MRVSKDLNSKNIKVTLDVLGEFIKTLDEAESNKKSILILLIYPTRTILTAISHLKPTSFWFITRQRDLL